MKDMSKATFFKLAAAAAALTVLISVIMVNIPWLGDVGSKEKADIVHLLNVLIVMSAVVFSIGMVMMVYAIWKYRAKPGDESDGEPIHGNTRLEIIWTLIPTLTVIFSGVYSAIILNDIEAKADNGNARKMPAAQPRCTAITASHSEARVEMFSIRDTPAARARSSTPCWSSTRPL